MNEVISYLLYTEYEIETIVLEKIKYYRSQIDFMMNKYPKN